jgi:hypothetical protein
MTTKQRRASAGRSAGPLHTPGGRTYLENLQRQAPTELTQKAIEQVEQEDANRKKDDR